MHLVSEGSTSLQGVRDHQRGEIKKQKAKKQKNAKREQYE
jgi:hypothetical protein